jgi:hypothetical protein
MSGILLGLMFVVTGGIFMLKMAIEDGVEKICAAIKEKKDV